MAESPIASLSWNREVIGKSIGSRTGVVWGAWGGVRTGQAWLDAYLFADGAEMAELLGHVYRVYLPVK